MGHIAYLINGFNIALLITLYYQFKIRVNVCIVLSKQFKNKAAYAEREKDFRS